MIALGIAALIVARKKKSTERARKRMMNSTTYPGVIEELGLVPLKPLTLTAVKQVGVSTDQNSMYRRTMEDEHVVVDKFADNDNQFYIAVYDGHGGKKTADYVKEHLHVSIAKELKSGDVSIEETFKKTFLAIDTKIKNTNEKSGSTAAVALITVKDGKKLLHTANCGDARIVLKRGKDALRMTIDHKATDPDEQKRIKDMGGIILSDKVGASLAVTRAFGDSELKEWVSAEPYIKSVELGPEDTHLIVACDGLWDVVSDQEAVDQLTSSQSAQELSDKLLKLALAKQTRDNLSVLVVVI
jgi:protein phosphatase PTC1